MRNSLFSRYFFLFAVLIPSLAQAQTTTTVLALDNPNLAWISTGNNPHGTGTTIVTNTHDGVDAWMSANRCAPTDGSCVNDNSRNILRTTVIGPGTLQFWWKASSEEGFDWFDFFVGGYQVTEPVLRLTGLNLPWVQETILLEQGTQTLEWIYSKDDGVSEGADRGWLDEVVYIPDPPAITNEPSDGETMLVPVGTNISFSVGYHSAGYPTVSSQKAVIWQHNGTNLVGKTNDTLTLTNLQLSQSGEYRVIITNRYGKATSEVAVVQVYQPVLLEWGLDTTGQVWTTSGDAHWFGVASAVDSHDGVDYVRSGIPPEDFENLSMTSFLSTTVVGPGVAKFWWRLNGLETDQFFVDVGGLVKTNVPNEDGEWQEESIAVPGGSRVVRFNYIRDDFISTDETDGGYLDQFRFFPATNAPPTFSHVNMSTNGFSALITHDPARFYRVQRSTNLITWTNVASFSNITSHLYEFEDSGALIPTNRQRFYRVVTP